ncbi:MAG: hypothetical protein H0W62_13800 [Chitinophagales bacterium]|nr:hypothetical protein [Chitinophagales bacterium]
MAELSGQLEMQARLAASIVVINLIDNWAKEGNYYMKKWRLRVFTLYYFNRKQP